MSVVMKIEGLINGGSTAFDGQYVVEYDPCRDGREPETGRVMMCFLATTPDKNNASRFAGVSEARELWAAIDQRTPLRPDGKPNRPLTAFTVLIENVD